MPSGQTGVHRPVLPLLEISPQVEFIAIIEDWVEWPQQKRVRPTDRIVAVVLYENHITHSELNSVVIRQNPLYSAKSCAVILTWIDKTQIRCHANQLLAIFTAQLELG